MRRGAHWDDGWRQRRGQSNLIGVVLLVGMIVAGATVVVVAGSVAIDQSQSQSSFSTAKQSMQSLDAEISRAAASNAPTRLEGLTTDSASIDPSAGSVTVSVTKYGATDSVSRDLGAIVYEQGDRTLAYQSGGLFERLREGTAVVSSPPVTLKTSGGEPTLQVPITTVEGSGVEERVEIQRTSVDALLSALDGDPSTGTDDPMKPLPWDSTVTVEITSDYAAGWERVFRDQFASHPSYASTLDVSRTGDTVTVELTVPRKPVTYPAALTVTGSGTLKLESSGTADMYDSSAGAYGTGPTPPAPIRSSDYVKIEDSITADVYSEDHIEVEGTLDGDACAESGISGSGTVSGSQDPSCSVDIGTFPLPDGKISSMVSTHSSSNDNGGCINSLSNDVVSDCTGSDELTTGTYYLGSGETINNDIDFDTSGGPINIVVDGDLTISGGTLDIVTTNPTHGVRFYVDGDLKIEGSPNVETDTNQRSQLMEFKIESGHGIKLEGGDIVGVIYAPGSGCGSESMKLETGAELFGAIVAECPDKLETVGTIHYDSALATAGGGGAGGTPDFVSYLHVTQEAVRVDGE